MTNLIKRKSLLFLTVIAVMVSVVCLISCGSDSVVDPTVDGGNNDAGSSQLNISEWFDNANWKKYETTIELNGKSVTYTIVFRYSDMGREVDIYDEYDGKEHFGYTWGYASGRKVAFFLSSRFVRFYNDDTIIIDQYYGMSRLQENNYKENTYISRSHYYDKDVTKKSRKEDFNDFALPKSIRLTSEGLLMTYYTYNTQTGDWTDNQTALFKF